MNDKRITVDSFLETKMQRIPTAIHVSHARGVASSVPERDRGRVRGHNTAAAHIIAEKNIGNESPDGADGLRPKGCLLESDAFFEPSIAIMPLLSPVLTH